MTRPLRSIRLMLVAVLSGCGAASQRQGPPAAATKPAAAPVQPVHMIGTEHVIGRVLRQPEEWYRMPEGRHAVDVILSWQNANGGWWKKYDPYHPRPAQVPAPDPHDGPPGDTESAWRSSSTFDNTATYTEMRIMAKAYAATGDVRYRDLFERGLGFMFAAQLPNGGWPQRFPLPNNYGREITFNDNAMLGVMEIMRDVADGKFPFVPEDERARARVALRKGIECTLACQVHAPDGHLTAWCQQYDEVTLAPAGARAYELPSVTASESTSIVQFLMRIPEPDGRVVAAVDAAVRWFKESEIHGKRWVTATGPQYENGHNRVLVDDPSAPPLWARFYDLQTNRPFFVSRDGVKRDSVDQISWERRNGYGWYGTWPQRVLDAYPDWKRRVEGRQ